MEQVRLSLNAREYIRDLRRAEETQHVRSSILNALSTISKLIHEGRGSESANAWVDDLLRTMYTLSEYNDLVNALVESDVDKQGYFCYDDAPETQELAAEEQKDVLL